MRTELSRQSLYQSDDLVHVDVLVNPPLAGYLNSLSLGNSTSSLPDVTTTTTSSDNYGFVNCHCTEHIIRSNVILCSGHTTGHLTRGCGSARQRPNAWP